MDTTGFEITLVIPGKVIAHDWITLLTAVMQRPLEVIELDVMKHGKVLQCLLARRKMKQIFHNKHYDVVHINTGSLWLQAICLECAKKAGVPKRIAHSHNSLTGVRRIAAFADASFRKVIVENATDFVACSNLAGAWLFGEDTWKEKGIVLKNGIEAERYTFDSARRATSRESVGNEIVIGTVGRLDYQKNQSFLLEVFARIASVDRGVRLWLIGDGPLRAELERQARVLGIFDLVTFWGARNDVSSLLQGMDVFVLPSRFEGLGIVLLEAQSAGLPCVASDAVPEEVDVEGCWIKHLPLDATVELWANAVVDMAGYRNQDGAALVRNAGYDLHDTTEVLEQLYRAASNSSSFSLLDRADLAVDSE